MLLGDVVAGRFVLEVAAASGGMGAVYKALDRSTGGYVAFKVLKAPDPGTRARFSQEIRLLSDLVHPAITAYVAHGEIEDSPWLAMQWVDGDTLHRRLARQGLSVADTLQMAARVADGLGYAHLKGIVHRDVKPANILLPGGDPRQAQIIDFGVARLRADLGLIGDVATQTGMVVGTMGYLSPEQARGMREIGPPADVFSLGVVLFKCLTGRGPFEAADPSAVLARILFQTPSRARELRPDLPPALDALVARMLEKDPDKRPPDGRAARDLLESIVADGKSPGPAPASAIAITTGERRLVSAIVASPDRWNVAGDEATEFLAPPSVDEIAAKVRALGGQMETLADGGLAVAVVGHGSAVDQAARAARCALAIRSRWRGPVAVATGRGIVVDVVPVGEAIDRAVALLDRRVQDGVSIDDVTSGLLDARFEVVLTGLGRVLKREDAAGEGVRTLLGKPTPCVGRDAELAVLHQLYEQCLDGPNAQGVLVTAPSGYGKSRLRHEFLRRIAEVPPAPEVWLARCDAMSQGSPFGVVAAIVQRACDMVHGEPPGARQRKVLARVSRCLPADQVDRVHAFLCELIGAGLDDTDRVQLRAARGDAMLMGDQLLRAWMDWLSAETSDGPLVLVLEDLQWGDVPSIRWLDATLRQLDERPLFVFAVARPEVHDAFPKLWKDRRVQEVRLSELTRRACERLVRAVLGAGAPNDRVGQIVEQSGGNALYLEELIRAAADHGSGPLPDTVIAMVQSRIEALEGEARWVLRAASVFGGVFWRGGIEALVGGERRSNDVGVWLDVLVERELLTRRATSRFPSQAEYVFRHALVREAAYGMLTDDDRQVGHALAGAWLEKIGESDAVVLAEHYERGKLGSRAVGFWSRSSREALEGNDFAAVIARTARAIACGAAGAHRGELFRLQAEARRWMGETVESARCAEEAVSLLTPGSFGWYQAAGELGDACGRASDYARLADLVQEIRLSSPQGGVENARTIAIARCAGPLLYSGQYGLVDLLFFELAKAVDPDHGDPEALAYVYRAIGHKAMFEGDTGASRDHDIAALHAFEKVGNLRDSCRQANSVGFESLELGLFAEAEHWLRGAMATADRLGLVTTAALARQNLGLARARQGDLDEGRRLLKESIVSLEQQGDARLTSGSLSYLALVEQLAGQLDAAAAAAMAALPMTESSPPSYAYALAIVADIELARGRLDAAWRAAERAHRLLDELGVIEEGESLVRLVWARVLEAKGRRADALAAGAAAQDRLLARARMIGDGQQRKSFLNNVPDHAAILGLPT